MLAPDQDQPLENSPDTSVELRQEAEERVTELRDTLDEDQWDYAETMVPAQEALSAVIDGGDMPSSLKQVGMDLSQQIDRFDQGKFQIWEMRRSAMRYLAVNSEIDAEPEGASSIVQSARMRGDIAGKVKTLIDECKQGKWGYEDMQPVEQALEPIVGHEGLSRNMAGIPVALKLAGIDLYLLIRAADRGQFDISEITKVASQYLLVDGQD
jgi:hypothetical protein